MRILFLDIETAPNLAYVWGLFKQNVNISAIEEPKRMICFAAKWEGEKKIHFYSEFHDGPQAMAEAAHKLLDEADVVVHYNGAQFDIPHLNTAIILAGLKPPSPFKSLDLLSTVRRRFNFPSTKLAYVAPALGLGEKEKHEGFEMWKKCLEGQKTAWKKMRKYNKQDVVLLQELYEKLKAWIPNHPSRNLYDGKGDCPICGGSRIQRRGWSYTKVSKYRRYFCKDCGGWLRGKSREKGIDVRQAAMNS